MGAGKARGRPHQAGEQRCEGVEGWSRLAGRAEVACVLKVVEPAALACSFQQELTSPRPGGDVEFPIILGLVPAHVRS